MSTPRRRPNSEQPHASRGARVRDAKANATNAVGSGIGETPHSLRFRLSVAAVIILVVVFMVTSITDRLGQ
jgi:hypothetical protein